MRSESGGTAAATAAPAALRIPPRIRRRLLREASAAAPREACGALLGVPGTDGTPDRVVSIVPLSNVADDPLRSFAVDPVQVAPLLRAGGVLGFYHSHPRGGVDPSERDVRGACSGWWNVIVSPREQAFTAWRAGARDA